MDTLAIALALLSFDGRAMPLKAQEIKSATFVLERTSNVSKPTETASLGLETIKVKEPKEIYFKGGN